jgi:hypothetical protein
MIQNVLLQCSDSFDKSTGTVPQVNYQFVLGTRFVKDSCVCKAKAPIDFILWGFVKDNIYVHPLLTTLPELKTWIREACAQDILHNMW